MEKINIAELLKDCPQGMELDCTMYDNLYFDSVNADYYGTINCYTLIDGIKTSINFTKYGTFNNHTGAKCVIFPKGKTTWEGFQRPFKDGDVIFYDNCVSIFKEWGDETLFRNYVKVDIDGKHPMLCAKTSSFGKCIKREVRFATEEEKAKLFQVIKDNGYHWNAETKTLEKLVESKEDTDRPVIAGIYFNREHYADEVELYLGNYEIEFRDGKTYVVFKNQKTKTLEKFIEPKFKVGDEIVKRNSISNSWIVSSVSSEYYGLKLPNGIDSIGVLPVSEQDDWELIPNIKPKFKVGDRIQGYGTHINYPIRVVKSLEWDRYILDNGSYIKFGIEHAYKLLKFDINTLKPFDKVLVRCGNGGSWTPQFFANYRPNSKFPFVCTYNSWSQCIPYEGNEHLLDTTNDCDEYYKIWENL